MIDSHAHLSIENPQLDEELQQAQKAGLEAIVNIAIDEPSLMKGLQLKEKSKALKIVLAAATTPHDVAKDGEHFFPLVVANAKELHAIGETGLDYYYEHSPREVQKSYFRKYLQLAAALQLPYIIHCRDAFQDLYAIMDEVGYYFGVLHCFTGTVDEALQGIKRGLLVSFSGIITFPKSEALREVVKQVPLEKMLIETDSPYLAPVPHRGKKNEPAFIIETAKTVASIKNMSLEIVAKITTENAKRFFSI